MKFIRLLAALAIVNPAFAQADGTSASAAPPMPTPPVLTAEQQAIRATIAEKRRERRERWAAMTEEERAAEIAKRKAEKTAQKAAQRQKVVDALIAAKAACKDCYKVVSKPGGGFVGLTKEEYEAYLANGKKLNEDGTVQTAAPVRKAALRSTAPKSSGATPRLPPGKVYGRLLEASAKKRYSVSDGNNHTFSRPRRAVQK